MTEMLPHVEISVKAAILLYHRKGGFVLSTPDDEIRLIGATIRAHREARRLTQQKAAKGAKVSRSQLAALERGGNVSAKLLLKITRYFGLSVKVAEDVDGEPVSIAAAANELNILEVIRSLDLVVGVVEHIRRLATNTLLPAASDQVALQDTPVLREFLARHLGDDTGLDRLAHAIVGLSDEVSAAAAAPRRPDRNSTQEAAERTRPRRRVRREK